MVSNISFSDVISLLSIIIAVVSLVISYFVWKEDRPKIKLKYGINEIIGAGIGKMYDVLSIDVINFGKRPITINKQVSLKFKKGGYLAVLFDQLNYIGVLGNSPYERLNEFSSFNIYINLETFRKNKEKLNLDNILGIVVNDTLGNEYLIKLEEKDKTKIEKYINKS